MGFPVKTPPARVNTQPVLDTMYATIYDNSVEDALHNHLPGFSKDLGIEHAVR